MRDFGELAKQVTSRSDLSRLIGLLVEDLSRSPTEWQNDNLADFLSALSAWLNDMDGYFANQGKEVPTEPSWGLFGMMLLAARVYE